MTDSERSLALRHLTQLYRAGDFLAARTSMPTFTDDESGEEFNIYFDFLQSIYLLQSEHASMKDSEVLEEAERLLDLAEKYNYPKNQIEVFLP